MTLEVQKKYEKSTEPYFVRSFLYFQCHVFQIRTFFVLFCTSNVMYFRFVLFSYFGFELFSYSRNLVVPFLYFGFVLFVYSYFAFVLFTYFFHNKLFLGKTTVSIRQPFGSLFEWCPKRGPKGPKGATIKKPRRPHEHKNNIPSQAD